MLQVFIHRESEVYVESVTVFRSHGIRDISDRNDFILIFRSIGKYNVCRFPNLIECVSGIFFPVPAFNRR